LLLQYYFDIIQCQIDKISIKIQIMEKKVIAQVHCTFPHRDLFICEV
jgi:hypothetical protein